MGLIEDLFRSAERPKWREEFEYRMYELENRTGLTKDQLRRVADALEELKVIRL
jgi:hypothetical protein